MKALFFSALLGAQLLAAPASAAVIGFEYQATDFNYFVSGSGSFTTTADTGSFDLEKGVTNFSAKGEIFRKGFDRESYSIGIGRLNNLNVTLDNGGVSSLSLGTGWFVSESEPVFTSDFPFVFYSETDNRFKVNGTGEGSLTYSFGYQPSKGSSFNITSFTATDPKTPAEPDPTGAVPEPATWAMMLVGFGAVGSSLRARRRRRTGTAAFA